MDFFLIQGLMSIITDTDIVSHFKTRVFKPSALQSDTTFISSGTVCKLILICIRTIFTCVSSLLVNGSVSVVYIFSCVAIRLKRQKLTM